jgi:hypothetical protein
VTRSRSRITLVLAVLGLAAVASGQARAGQVVFVPPNDTTGHVFTTNSNDGWSAGRGDVFQMSANTTIDSVGVYQDLTNVLLSYKILEVTTTVGDLLPGSTVLRSGSGTATTSGLQFIDFSVAPLTLLAGHDYEIAFSFAGASNQNFFYNNQNIPFNQASFNFIDGTQADETSNSVMPAIRVNTPDTNVVPEPATVVSAGIAGLTGLGLALRRRRAAA